MSITARVLLLSEDPSLREEAKLAFELLDENAPRFRFVSDANQLFDVLRNQPIDLVLIEFTDVPRDLLLLVPQVLSLNPRVRVAAILRAEGFPEDINESAVLIDAMRNGVCDFLRRPLSIVDLRRLISGSPGMEKGNVEAAPRNFARVVSFISNKGGVGKSTLATNVAVEIAKRGQHRVLLIDGSLQMGVAAALLDVTPKTTLTDLARERDRLDATMVRQATAVHSSGLHLLAAPADAVEAMEIDDILLARIVNLAKQTYDLIIIDTFPMFDRVVVAALDLSDRAYIILENVVPTLLGGVKLLSVLERIGFPAEKQSVVLNRYQRLAGALSVEDVAERMQRDIRHVLPFDKRVMAAANCGVPIAMAMIKLGGFNRALTKLANDIADFVDARDPASTDRGLKKTSVSVDR